MQNAPPRKNFMANRKTKIPFPLAHFLLPVQMRIAWQTNHFAKNFCPHS
jgi:hypothetical protein